MMNIAIFAGGNSSEREISLKTANQIYENIDNTKYKAYIVDVKGIEWHVIENEEKYSVDKNELSFNKLNQKIKFNYAWIAIHGAPGENGELQGYLDMMQIPYSSCNLLISALSFDKHICKLYLNNFNIPMAKSIMISKGDEINFSEIIANIGLPLFVKPNTSGSSFGVSKVKSAEELPTAIENAYKEDNNVIIEAFVNGTEVGCGVFKSKTKSYILPVTEIVSPNEFFDYDAKYFSKDTQEITPARISAEQTELVQKYTSIVYDALYCTGVARADFIIQDGIPFFIEINSVPGMSKESIVPKQLENMGIKMQDFISEII
ncbi:MAG: D-alanine--D-alanine ligase, partial [Bacteroidales bacterium]|nr:D-alanine--D-alanine ligase [Bacteroidales bacterium]